jgi:hypothetical protein
MKNLARLLSNGLYHFGLWVFDHIIDPYGVMIEKRYPMYNVVLSLSSEEYNFKFTKPISYIVHDKLYAFFFEVYQISMTTSFKIAQKYELTELWGPIEVEAFEEANDKTQ